MATTTNFGWTTPDDTSLVKDGASAIRTLGSSIDTSMGQLKGGTTGQILSKTSNTDMAFTWINNDQGDITAVTAGTGLTGGGTTGAVTLSLDSTAVISPTIVDAKGDLIAATGADAVARLAVGTNGQYLVADSTTATGLKWATLSQTESYTFINGSAGTALTGAATITVSGFSGYNKLFIIVDGASSASASSRISLRLNTDSNNNYTNFGFELTGVTTNTRVTSGDISNVDNYFYGATMGTSAANSVAGYFTVEGANSTARKMVTFAGSANGTSPVARVTGGTYNGTSAITSVSLISESGNFDSGTLYVFGA